MDYLIGHLVGDYIFQTDGIAAHKRASSVACGIHVGTYVLAIWLFTGWPWRALAITMICHFLQDRFGLARTFMRYTQHEAFATGPLAPWSIIITDNTLHLVQLWLTAQLVMS